MLKKRQKVITGGGKKRQKGNQCINGINLNKIDTKEVHQGTVMTEKLILLGQKHQITFCFILLYCLNVL